MEGTSLNIFKASLSTKSIAIIVMVLVSIAINFIGSAFGSINIIEDMLLMHLSIYALLTLIVALLLLAIWPMTNPTKIENLNSRQILTALLLLWLLLSAVQVGTYIFQYQSYEILPLAHIFFANALIVTITAQIPRYFKEKPKTNTEVLLEPEETIEVIGNLNNEKLLLNSTDLFLVKSSDNYSEFYYRGEEGLERKLIRLTLKSVEDQLSQSYLIRTHKSYLVNLYKIDSISGNINNTKLFLKDFDLEAPVSRKKRDAVLEAYEELS